MKVLVVDQEGLALSYVLRARNAGHQVRWFIKPKKNGQEDKTGEGFKGVEKIDNWVPSVPWAELIFCTFNADYIERLEFFKKKGFPVFAPSVASSKLEINRKDGMKLLEKVGIEVAPYHMFKTMGEAEKFVLKTQERYVFKTLGDNEDKSLTYVSKSPADLIAWMRRTPPPKGEMMLQNFIHGVEMGVSRFLGSKGWVGQWNESFEHKKLMPGNFGPNTGEMGTVAYFTPESKLGKETLAKCEEELVKLGHLGDAALGFIIDETGKPWPTEWTMRMGWPISNMMLGATKGDPVSWMKDALSGKDTTSFSEEIGACVILAHADFPYEKADKEDINGVPIYGVTRGNAHHIHPQGVQMMKLPDMRDGKVHEHDIWATSAEYVLIVTGFGKNVSQASKRAYKTIKQLHVANAIVRDDIGEGLEEQLPELHKLGYALHCNYA